jgi:hypothetical protein
LFENAKIEKGGVVIKNCYALLFLVLMTFLCSSESALSDKYYDPDFRTDIGFVENKGQWDYDILFAHKGINKNIYIVKDRIVFDFFNIRDKDDVKEGTVLSMNLDGLSPKMKYLPMDVYDHHFNYFIGDDSDKWAKNVKIYRNIKISDIYDNIDLFLIFDKDDPRYDIIVNPGGDPEDISIKYEGQDEIKVNDEGNIELIVGDKVIENNSLYAYQEIDGLKRRVDCRFHISDNSISFKLGEYSKDKQLVIDPIVLSSYFGGSDRDMFKTIKKDKNGDLYLIGTTNSSDFYITPGAYKKEKDYYQVASISKIKISGDSTELLYSTFFGGSGGDGASDIYIDDNNIYFTGYTNSFDFPKVKSISNALSGGTDCFVVKMNDSLNEIEYSTVFGGNLDDWPMSLDVESGEVYLTGHTRSTNFPTTPSCFQERNAGQQEVFVSKLSYSGNSLLYSTYVGGAGEELPYKIHLINGAAVIGGTTSSSIIENVKYGYDITGNGSWDGFIARINNTGNTLDYFTFIGGTNAEFLFDFDVDPTNGDAYFVGNVEYDNNMRNFPKTALGDSTFKGGFDNFLGKLSSTGSELKVITILGGREQEDAHSLIFEPVERNIYVTGSTQSMNFPVTEDHIYKLDNTFDPYISIFESDSLNLIFSTLILSENKDMFSGYITLEDRKHPIILVNTTREYYPIIGKPIQSEIGGDLDGYFFKYVIGQIRIDPGFRDICTGDEISISWTISKNLEKINQLIQIKQLSKEHWINIGNRSDGTDLKIKIPDAIVSGDDYMLRITHPSGLHSNEYGPFAIHSAPKVLDFKTNTGETTVCEDESFQLIADMNEEELDFVWYHDGNVISEINQPVLEFDQIKPENSGEYWFKASNYCKPDITSEKLNITVYEATEIIEGPNDTTVTEGKTVILWVSAIGGNLKYQWYKNDQVLLGAFDPTLEIKNIKKSDEAYYHCEIEGECGNFKSERALITVESNSSIADDIIEKSVGIEIHDNIVSTELIFNVTPDHPKECSIEIVDINGVSVEFVYDGIISKSKSFITDIIDLPSATYWVIVRSEGKTYEEKFVVYR